MNKAIVIFVIGVLIAGGILVVKNGGGGDSDAPANNVSIVDGVQIVEVSAKGGYRPKKSVAQAGIPTIPRVKTSSTFDCSRAFRIPSMNYNTILPQSGNTDIDLGSPTAGTLNAMCSMGMYRLSVEFK